ncbi:MAG: hypothetical protein WD690_12850 [Vicinamibacterales bacterium]
MPASRFSFNIGIGSVGSTSRATPGAVTLASIGTDVRLFDRVSLRIEAGRRAPSTREWTAHSMYYFPSPDGPDDIGASIGVESTTRVTERSLADIAILLRYAWPVRERFEVAFLSGLDLSVMKFRHHTTIPASLTDPSDVHVFEGGNRRTLGVFDFGLEGGARVGERWTLLVYGLGGLPSPFEEHRPPQLRTGVILKRHERRLDGGARPF